MINTGMKYIFASSTIGVQILLGISLLLTIVGLFMYPISSIEISMILLGYVTYGCLGIVVTFHRYLTHQSYTARPFLVKIFSILGCFAGTGSPLAWVAIHINHHLKSDKPDDPHSPHYKGANIFTLDYVDQVNVDTKWRMRNLVKDKFQQFLHRYYFLIIIAYNALLYIIGGFYLMVFLYFVPAVVTGLMSNVVNYVGHMPNWFGGFRRYNLSDQSTNNWLWAIPSWGEAWHNNHHRFPKRSYFGDKWYEVDISGLIIKLIRK